MNIGVKIITFGSHHFEEFVYIFIGFFASAVAIYIALLVRQRPLEKQIRSYVDTAIGTTLTFLFLFGGALTLCIFWNNYNTPFINFDLHDEIQASVHWVEDNLQVYIVNERDLVSLHVDGSEEEIIFSSDDKIRDFQFSPDGKYLLIATYKELYIFDREKQEKWLVDSVNISDKESDLRGTVSGIRWSPNSKYFTYEVARWSKYSSQDNVYVYEMATRKKRSIKTPARKITSLLWDMKSENLYYLRHESSELDERDMVYKIKVYRIDLTELKTEFVTDILTDKAEFPELHFEILGIELYKTQKGLRYGRIGEYASLKSPIGGEVGIDKYNYFFYKQGWFRKRLFKVKREVDKSKKPTMLNTYGEHLLQQIRWTPSGRYVIMDHPYWGVLVLDPKRRKIGQLYPYEVSAYGWYDAK